MLVLLIWGFMGFLLFRGLHAHFETLPKVKFLVDHILHFTFVFIFVFILRNRAPRKWLNLTFFCLFGMPNGLSQAFYVALHCFLSRPSSLFRLAGLIDVSYFSGIYFVSLSLAADVLVGSLIIAVGVRYYRGIERSHSCLSSIYHFRP
jgi:hypothetical protein